MILDILDHWAGKLGRFPYEYVAYDLETTGLSIDEDLPWQIGICEYVPAQACRFVNYLVNWFDHPAVNPVWLNHRIADHTAHMVQIGKPTHCSVDRLLTGRDPRDVLRLVVELFQRSQRDGIPIVGHNIVRFDNNMLETVVRKYAGSKLTLDPELLIDTGALVKAAQTGTMPKLNESIGAYCKRVLTQVYAPGKYYSLDRFCVSAYHLDVLYGIDPARMHSAGYDAMVSAVLLEELAAGAEVCDDGEI